MNECALFRTILLRLAKGEMQKVIAADMDVPEHETFSRMRFELEASDNLQAVLEGLRRGWISLQDIGMVPAELWLPPADCPKYRDAVHKLAEGYWKEEAAELLEVADPPNFYKALFLHLGAKNKIMAVLEAMRRGWISLGTIEPVRRRQNPLTKGERDVLRLLATGVPDRGIACRLNISPRSVGMHKSRAKRKMAASDSKEAARLACAYGYLD